MHKKGVLISFIGLVFAVTTAFAADVVFSLSKVSGMPGETKEVALDISSINKLEVISAMVQVNYDSSKLEFVSVSTQGTIAQPWGAPISNSTIPGQIKLAMFGTESLQGKGKFLKINLKARDNAQAGKSEIKLLNVKLNDGKKIKSVLHSGSFTVLKKATGKNK
jgi:hypothetical protein